MKYLSWNVNGIRAVLQKNFIEFLETEKPDCIGLQETKGHFDQLEKKDQEKLKELGYYIYWNGAQRPGYSGTAALSKVEAISVEYGIDKNSFESQSLAYMDETLLENYEGRVTTLEFETHFFVTVYTPNSKDDLSRLGYRYEVWDKAFLQYLIYLEQKKPVVVCGDLNVAHKEIDLARPKDNIMSAGFTREEREGINHFVESGFIDTFRYLYCEEKDRYTWWSYRAGARARNVGWRIDYFLCSNSLIPHLRDAVILDKVMGSDHCPVGIVLNI